MSAKGIESNRKGTIHVIQQMSHGGVETLVKDLASQLPGENRIFSLDGSTKQIIDAWPELAERESQIRGFSKKAGISPGLLLGLRNTLRQLKPYSVITHHIGPLIYGGLAARLAQVPLIAHVEHDIWHYNLPRHKLMTKAVHSIVRPKIIGVSIKAADTFSEITGGKNVSVINSGVDTKRFKPADKAAARARWNIPESAPVIGCVGRLERVKGHDVLLDALVGLPNGIMCVLVGVGSRIDALKEKASSLGIEEQVIFLGQVDDITEVYSAFDILCQPSRAEGLPLAVLEAQACGIPVVATDVGSVRDAVCPDIGRVVEPGDPDDLAVALLDLLKEPDIASPRAFVAENFSWGDTLSAYSKMVRV